MQDNFDKLNEIFGVKPDAANKPADNAAGEPARKISASGEDVKNPLEKLDRLLYKPEEQAKISEEEYDDELEERDFMPIRPSRSGKIGCLGGLMYFVFVISISIVLACLGWMAAADVLALNKPMIEATITLPGKVFTDVTLDVTDAQGNVTGTRQDKKVDIDYVADSLKSAGIIEYKWLFKAFCAVSNADIKIDPGTYELATDLDYRALVKNMQVGTGAMITTKIMFPEGYTAQQIFEKLEEEGVCTVEELYTAASDWVYNYSFLEWSELGDRNRLEGYLFPDTYDFYQGMQASSALNKFLNNFHSKLTADMYKQAENLNMTLHQAIIIASMVEAEAANDEERAIIASVIYNRLSSGMVLNIDATIQYILPERKENLSLEDLKIDNPYNTYIYPGLPPGPVSNPGVASLNAALQPASTGYYYYALDMETGAHQFFVTYDEHQAFVATQDYSSLGD